MDSSRRGDGARQSSLPSSLHSHLFSGPQRSSTTAAVTPQGITPGRELEGDQEAAWDSPYAHHRNPSLRPPSSVSGALTPATFGESSGSPRSRPLTSSPESVGTQGSGRARRQPMTTLPPLPSQAPTDWAGSDPRNYVTPYTWPPPLPPGHYQIPPRPIIEGAGEPGPSRRSPIPPGAGEPGPTTQRHRSRTQSFATGRRRGSRDAALRGHTRYATLPPALSTASRSASDLHERHLPPLLARRPGPRTGDSQGGTREWSQNDEELPPLYMTIDPGYVPLRPPRDFRDDGQPVARLPAHFPRRQPPARHSVEIGRSEEHYTTSPIPLPTVATDQPPGYEGAGRGRSRRELHFLLGRPQPHWPEGADIPGGIQGRQTLEQTRQEPHLSPRLGPPDPESSGWLTGTRPTVGDPPLVPFAELNPPWYAQAQPWGAPQPDSHPAVPAVQLVNTQYTYNPRALASQDTLPPYTREPWLIPGAPVPIPPFSGVRREPPSPGASGDDGTESSCVYVDHKKTRGPGRKKLAEKGLLPLPGKVVGPLAKKAPREKPGEQAERRHSEPPPPYTPDSGQPSVAHTAHPAGNVAAPARRVAEPAHLTPGRRMGVQIASPAHHTASPAHFIASPAHHTASPAHHTASPAHHTAGPAHRTASPAHYAAEPAGVQTGQPVGQTAPAADQSVPQGSVLRPPSPPPIPPSSLLAPDAYGFTPEDIEPLPFPPAYANSWEAVLAAGHGQEWQRQRRAIFSTHPYGPFISGHATDEDEQAGTSTMNLDSPKTAAGRGRKL
ncbi:predicted protein [Postia placenta Mad-698-R]|nr:predicted protein [Postia placenta Mad-698-R]